MNKSKYITIFSRRKKVELEIDKILYVLMKRNDAEIHVCGDRVYVTRRTFAQLKEELGDIFIEVRRGCIVSAYAIHEITKRVELNNGESLKYTTRKKKVLIEQFRKIQQNIIESFNSDNIPETEEEYRNHYSSFENLSVAFTDIELVFNEEKHAVDWIFRYGNEALAEVEGIPLEQLIGNTFSSIFKNMDSKWLHNYERSALYGETLEIIDYSPEIDKWLKIISFPTFKGHCGCLLFDDDNIKTTKNSRYTV